MRRYFASFQTVIIWINFFICVLPICGFSEIKNADIKLPFGSTTPVYILINTCKSSEDVDCRSKEFDRSMALNKKLNAHFFSLINDTSKLFKDRLNLVDEYFQALTQSKDFANELRGDGAFLFYLFPDKTYLETVGILKLQLDKNRIYVKDDVFEDIRNINKPSDCNDVSLMNDKSIKALRRTYQGPATCYVHAGVRAMDYLNFSTQQNTPPTSIVEAAIGSNSSNRNVSIAYGKAENVIHYLKNKGGCGLTPFDTADEDQELYLEQLSIARKELDDSLKTLEDIPLLSEGDLLLKQKLYEYLNKMEVISEIYSKWSITTQELVQKAVHNSEQVKRLSKDSAKLTDKFGVLNQIAELTNEFKNQKNGKFGRYGSLDGYASFGDFIFKKAYCSPNRITYAPATTATLFSTHDSSHYKPVVKDINDHFNSANPQVLITSLYTGSFYDPMSLVTRTRNHHVVLVVGQKYDNRIKQCSYQILNSYGGSQGKYHPSYEVENEWGTIWMPKTQFLNSIIEITYLKPIVELTSVLFDLLY